MELQKPVDSLGGFFEVRLCKPYRAAAVNGVCELRADVGVRNACAAFGEHASLVESLNPKLPIFAAHGLDGFENLALVGGGNFDVHDRAPVGVEALVFALFADGFEDALVDFARLRVGAARRRERVHNQIHLSLRGLLDCVNRLFFDFVRKGVAVDVRGVKPRRFRLFRKFDRVVPARACGAFAGDVGGTLEEHAHRRSSAAERRHYAARQSVARGRADNERAFAAVFDFAPAFNIFYLFAHVRRAAFWVRGNAQKALDFGSNYHVLPFDSRPNGRLVCGGRSLPQRVS